MFVNLIEISPQKKLFILKSPKSEIIWIFGTEMSCAEMQNFGSLQLQILVIEQRPNPSLSHLIFIQMTQIVIFLDLLFFNISNKVQFW